MSGRPARASAHAAGVLQRGKVGVAQAWSCSRRTCGEQGVPARGVDVADARKQVESVGVVHAQSSMRVSSVEESVNVVCLLFVHRDDTLARQGLASAAQGLSTAFPPLPVGFPASGTFAYSGSPCGLQALCRAGSEAV